MILGGETGLQATVPANDSLSQKHVLENKFYRVAVNNNGTLTILDKQTGQTYDQALKLEEVETPLSYSLFTKEMGGSVLSAVKKAKTEDALIVRLYNASETDKITADSIQFTKPVIEWTEVRMDETPVDGSELSPQQTINNYLSTTAYQRQPIQARSDGNLRTSVLVGLRVAQPNLRNTKIRIDAVQINQSNSRLCLG